MVEGDLERAAKLSFEALARDTGTMPDDARSVEDQAGGLFEKSAFRGHAGGFAVSAGLGLYALGLTRRPEAGMLVLNGMSEYAKATGSDRLAMTAYERYRSSSDLDGHSLQAQTTAANVLGTFGTLCKVPAMEAEGAGHAWSSFEAFRNGRGSLLASQMTMISIVLIGHAFRSKEAEAYRRAIIVAGSVKRFVDQVSPAMMYVSANLAVCRTVISPLQEDGGIVMMERAIDDYEDALGIARKLGRMEDARRIETDIGAAQRRLSEAQGRRA